MARHVAFGTLTILMLARAAEGAGLERCAPATAERIRFIEERLEARRSYADWWWKGWTGTYGVGMVVQSVRAGLEDDDDGERADYVVGAVKAAFGTGRLLFSQPTARQGAAPMQAIEPTGEAACQERLTVGEDLLRKNAKETESRWSWKRHATNVAVNFAGGAIVAEGFGNSDGWTSAGVGTAVGAAMLLSHPWRADDDLEEYERRFQGGGASGGSGGVRFGVAPRPGGAQLVFSF